MDEPRIPVSGRAVPAARAAAAGAAVSVAAASSPRSRTRAVSVSGVAVGERSPAVGPLASAAPVLPPVVDPVAAGRSRGAARAPGCSRARSRADIGHVGQHAGARRSPRRVSVHARQGRAAGGIGTGSSRPRRRNLHHQPARAGRGLRYAGPGTAARPADGERRAGPGRCGAGRPAAPFGDRSRAGSLLYRQAGVRAAGRHAVARGNVRPGPTERGHPRAPHPSQPVLSRPGAGRCARRLPGRRRLRLAPRRRGRTDRTSVSEPLRGIGRSSENRKPCGEGGRAACLTAADNLLVFRSAADRRVPRAGRLRRRTSRRARTRQRGGRRPARTRAGVRPARQSRPRGRRRFGPNPQPAPDTAPARGIQPDSGNSSALHLPPVSSRHPAGAAGCAGRLPPASGGQSAVRPR